MPHRILHGSDRPPIASTFGELAELMAKRTAVQSRAARLLDEPGPLEIPVFERILEERRDPHDIAALTIYIAGRLGGRHSAHREIKLASAAAHLIDLLELESSVNPDAKAALVGIANDLETHLRLISTAARNGKSVIGQGTLELAERVLRAVPASAHGTETLLRVAMFLFKVASPKIPTASGSEDEVAVSSFSPTEIDFAVERLAIFQNARMLDDAARYPVREALRLVERASPERCASIVEHVLRELTPRNPPEHSMMHALRNHLATHPVGQFTIREPDYGSHVPRVSAGMRLLLSTSYFILLAEAAARRVPADFDLAPLRAFRDETAWHPAHHSLLRSAAGEVDFLSVDWARHIVLSQAVIRHDKEELDWKRRPDPELLASTRALRAFLDSPYTSFDTRSRIDQYRVDLRRLGRTPHEAHPFQRLRQTSTALTELYILELENTRREGAPRADRDRARGFILRQGWHPIFDHLEPRIARLADPSGDRVEPADSDPLTSHQVRLFISRVEWIADRYVYGCDIDRLIRRSLELVKALTPCDAADTAEELFLSATRPYQYDATFKGTLIEKVSANAMEDLRLLTRIGSNPLTPAPIPSELLAHLRRMHCRSDLLRFLLTVGSAAAERIEDPGRIEYIFGILNHTIRNFRALETSGFDFERSDVIVRHPPVRDLVRNAVLTILDRLRVPTRESAYLELRQAGFFDTELPPREAHSAGI